MAAPKEVLELIERFDANVHAYKSPQYKEAQVRQEFINPFFDALGWDVYNRKGYAENYKEVVHEDTVKIGMVSKAPDYAFRLAGMRKFFVEAKTPAVNLKDDPAPALQLRRYAWNAKLPLSILTDFEEFAVYDCRVKPLNNDKPHTYRKSLYTYKEYVEKWDDIAAVFSPEAIMKGSFDKYVGTWHGVKGTAEVDKEFLKEIERWRDVLARNIALRNPALTGEELNFAVQQNIDRIIFLRICEDRGIEPDRKLMQLLNGTNTYERLCQFYTSADQRYNSGLFHFETEKGRGLPDTITKNISADDKVIKEIIKSLYPPDSPYEFSVFPADILGQVYEQFLGKVIRLTPGHQAKVEDKPEVKKAGGVYYTPTYIVDYIVKNTVGKLLDGKTPKDVSKIKILDPACGSGSFLIQAYQYLLDWHLDWYTKNNPEQYWKGKKPALAQPLKNVWRLTTAEKKRILLNNIFGVDIDTQAVEVTKLSLLLKVLEGEDEITLKPMLLHERALPDLDSNIKCGNSLIGTDIFQGQGSSSMGQGKDEELQKINPFDWEKEFSEIFKNGGFDAVIGNPPYVRQESLGAEFKQYAQKKFSAYAGTADLYIYFIEQSHRLLKQGGLFGMICSNKFMRANYGKALRDFLKDKTALLQLVDFGELPVFQNAATFPIIILTANETKKTQNFIYAPIKRLDFQSLAQEVKAISKTLNERSLHGDNWTLANPAELTIIEKMRSAGIPLGKYVKGKIYYGIKTGLNEAFVIDTETRNRLIAEDPKSAELIKPFVVGDDVRKYHLNFKERYLIFIPKGWTNENKGDIKDAWNWLNKNYPAIAEHLSSFAQEAGKRCDKGDYWWELRACDYYDKFETPKIMYPDIAKESRFIFDSGTLYMANTVYFLPTDDLYLLGILNSKLMFFYFKRNAAVLGDADKGGRLRWFSQDVEKLPIPRPLIPDPISPLVSQILSLNKQLASAKTPHEQTALQRRIEAVDKQIDTQVYQLYGLTEGEIATVEGKDRN